MCLPLLYNTDGDERGAKESNTYVKLAGNNLFHFYPSQIPTVPPLISVTMYNYHPRRLAKSNIEKQYFSHRVNDVCNGSPSRIRRVLRISFGMTILPRSSTRRTMPVAFIFFSPLKRKALFTPVEVFAGKGELCMRGGKREESLPAVFCSLGECCIWWIDGNNL